MKIEQIYTGCLAQGAYYIESNGEAAIIDPLREVSPYIKKAAQDNAKIKYIFETHFHADFVSGHVTLSKQTGTPIVYGPLANPAFDAIIAEDNQEFKIGDISIIALHTPGHTMESTTYLLKDENGKDHAIFSGDTLFLGDVGRPDLAQKAGDITKEDLAGFLFDTLGNQKQMNYALRADMTKEEFIAEVTDGLLPPPQYFPLNVKMNKEGYDDIDEVLKRGTKALSPNAFEVLANETGAIVLDVRHQSEFVKGHIPRSIFIGIDGGFAPWVGALIADVEQPILIVADKDRVEETVTRLSRVGFDNTLGYLEGGYEAWEAAGKETDTIESISANEFKNRMEANTIPVFDVRKEGEFLKSHLPTAHFTPLDYLNQHLAEFPNEETFYVHCAGGYRSVIAASILKSRGIHNLVDVAGGFGAIKKSGIPVTDEVCPSTLKK
ncbi:MBL fold metallo-hydrolase [Gaetbulibacter jejuensis]|uniref:MBL fold metallo-hydrolase n=1 Tax=Gaetbulibacter jejuensis TaxID=584607 RepID=A0ABP3UWD4_9FLAO